MGQESSFLCGTVPHQCPFSMKAALGCPHAGKLRPREGRRARSPSGAPCTSLDCLWHLKCTTPWDTWTPVAGQLC